MGVTYLLRRAQVKMRALPLNPKTATWPLEPLTDDAEGRRRHSYQWKGVELLLLTGLARESREGLGSNG